jgi:hypothetical protein
MLVANYPTKNSLKNSVGQELRFEETSIFEPEYRSTGRFVVVGPTATNRKFFAEVTIENDKIVRVK